MIPPKLRPYQESFIRLFYPEECGLCRSLLSIHKSQICPQCRARLAQIQYSFGNMLQSHTHKNLGSVWALYPYQFPIRELLTQFKYARQRRLINTLSPGIRESGRLITAECAYDGIVPIPVTRLTLLEREYNQTELLASHFSKAAGIPIKRVLKKSWFYSPQHTLNREDRLFHISGAFKLSSAAGQRVQNKRLLLVDDILTTGATCEEAASVLKKAGAAKVDLFVIAHTQLASS